MAEAFMMRRVGETKKVPVLNPAFPADVGGLIESASARASFSVSIAEHGVPDEYTYQWYRNSAPISGATGPTYTAAFPAAGTYTFYCVVGNAAGNVTSRVARVVVASAKPVYSYTGAHQLIDDGGYNWRLKLLTSGVLTFSYLGNGANGLDAFLAGGGAGGAWGGGGGGYTKTSVVNANITQSYGVVIGAGGAGGANAGGTTSIMGVQAAGGQKNADKNGGNGGNGGGAGGASTSLGDGPAGGKGGSNGGNGANSSGTGGTGQGTTTREFGESSGTLYAGGGGGMGAMVGGAGGDGGGGSAVGGNANAKDGGVNTGGGGAGYYATYNGRAGGSGIVVIRNKR